MTVAIANVTVIAFGTDPTATKLDTEKKRNDLL